MANAYFLVLASLQTIPEITNTFRVPTILLPLSAVIIVDAFFAIVEVSVLSRRREEGVAEELIGREGHVTKMT